MKKLISFILLFSCAVMPHLFESIGFEFEDHGAGLDYKIQQNTLPLQQGSLFHFGTDFVTGQKYLSLEIRTKPFKFNDIKITPINFDHYEKFYVDLTAGFNNINLSDNKDKHSGMKLSYTDPEIFINKGQKSLVPGQALFNINPQATFSLDIRKVYHFLKLKDYPYHHVRTRNTIAMIDWVLHKKHAKEIDILEKNLNIENQVKGFIMFLAICYDDVITAINNDSMITFWKYKHPLYLKRNMGDYLRLIGFAEWRTQNNRQLFKDIFKEFYSSRYREKSNKYNYWEKLIEIHIDYMFDFNSNSGASQYFLPEISSFYPLGVVLNFSRSGTMDGIEKIWGEENKNQYIFLEMRNFKSFNALVQRKKLADKSIFLDVDKVYKRYHIGPDEAIAFANDFTSMLLKFHSSLESSIPSR